MAVVGPGDELKTVGFATEVIGVSRQKRMNIGLVDDGDARGGGVGREHVAHALRVCVFDVQAEDAEVGLEEHRLFHHRLQGARLVEHHRLFFEDLLQFL